MEADFRWRYHVDYRDLPWRTRAALIRHLPADSAVAAIGRAGPLWTVEAHLLDDIRMVLMLQAGAKDVKPHPQRPKPTRQVDPERQKKLAAARRRARHRRQRIEAGEIT